MPAPRQLGFRIVQVTGEDEDYPASELNTKGPSIKGWQAPRFCHYPQEIILELEARCRISKIQILSHQYLIATKMELYVGNLLKGALEKTIKNVRWMRLGEVLLSDNDCTDYRARELKSILVDVVGTFVRFVLMQNYINKLNLCNQVGLVAVNLIGEPTEEEESDEASTLWWRKEKTSAYDELPFEVYVDKEVALLLRKLEEKKYDAIADEQFEFATQLKKAMEDLQMLGEKLGKLELEKQWAVDAENYDKAKFKRELMEKIRVQTYGRLKVTDLLNFTISRKSAPDKNATCIPIHKALPKDLPKSPQKLSAKSPTSAKNINKKQSNMLTALAVSVAPTTAAFSLNHNGIIVPAMNKSTQSDIQPSASSMYDEGVVPVLKNKGKIISEVSATPTDKGSISSNANILSNLNSNREVIVEFKRVDSVTPSSRSSCMSTVPLGPQDNIPIQVFGLPMMEKMWAKNFVHREASLKKLHQFLQLYTFPSFANEDPFSPDMVVQAAVLVLERALLDKVYSVFNHAAESVKLLLTKFVQSFKVDESEITSALEKLLKPIVLRTGDTNPRIQNAAVNSVLDLCSNRELKAGSLISGIVLEPFEDTLDPAKAVARCLLLEKLLEKFFVRATSWFPVKNAMSFCLQALQHEDALVRSAAERLMLALYTQAGDDVLQHLPPSQDDVSGHWLGSIQTDRPFSLPLPRMPSEVTDDSKEFESFCIFCKQYNPLFARLGLDVHYWQECPMLTTCTSCGVILEVSALTEHLLGECENRSQQSQCPRCLQAVPVQDLNQHMQEKTCLLSQPEYLANRCPLCRHDISPWEEGWRSHLMGLPGCHANPRNNRHSLSLNRSQELPVVGSGPSRIRGSMSRTAPSAAFRLQPLLPKESSATATQRPLLPTQRVSR